MNILRIFVVLLYLCLYLIVGGLLIVLASNIFTFDQISSGLNYVYNNHNLKLTMGIVGVLFVLIGILSAQISFGKMQREKTIAFENPDGQVVISLNAIEDFIRKIVKQIPYVKELKSTVTANKKGISVVSRATLFSDANIPETTSKIQSMIKERLLEMLGIEESINVRIHIAKLLHRTDKDEIIEPKETSRHMPFRDWSTKAD